MLSRELSQFARSFRVVCKSGDVLADRPWYRISRHFRMHKLDIVADDGGNNDRQL